MKVAMILRPDADSVFGGDTVVMQKMSAAMRELGADTFVGHQDEMPPAREFDLLHIFALAAGGCTRRAWWLGRDSGGLAIVFSPLYYSRFS